ncbi:glycosyltransferase family 4 protein [Salinibacter ruber]|uniref:glycosyltransferase family 4 protein n=1 Tax=Salinibacter ruber TaxID=146919 RepID=UPI00216A1731|nr:glycosyltransferase family 4 protein [Salinibacter ruber]MCS4150741.1 glycosyltransferase involved in cell wall biosynthesis [Salinibacter ruber]
MKIAYFANTGWYLYNFRLSLLKQARERGNDVLLVSPEDEYVSELQAEGFRWCRCPIDRKSLNPLKGSRSIVRLVGLLREERPDLIHNFTLKSIVYGSLAARITGVPRRVNAITGLGHYFSNPSGVDRVIMHGLRHLLRYSLSGSQIIFQNPDDLETVVEHGMAPVEDCHLIRSSGVDTDTFQPQEEPDEPITILLASRMLWSKGIEDFVKAGRHLVEDGAKARVVIVGAPDEGNPDAIPRERLQAWDEEPGVEWWGFRDDMPQVLGQSHVVCLPTRYGEGVPKILTEAAAAGRPLVATDVAGCQEIVQDGENGFLVPPGDSSSLAQALRSLIESPDDRRRMGTRSRKIAENKFSDEKVIEETLSVYENA